MPNKPKTANRATCIYIIKSCVHPERFYIGSAIDLYQREWHHWHFLKNKKHDNRKLQNHYNKYGEEDLYFDILEIVDDKRNLIKREQYYMDLMKPYFNLCPTAGNMLGLKQSEEARANMRLAKLNQSEETKRKISESKKGKRPPSFDRLMVYLKENKGKMKLSDEIRQRRSQNLKGKITIQIAKCVLSNKYLSQEKRIKWESILSEIQAKRLISK